MHKTIDAGDSLRIPDGIIIRPKKSFEDEPADPKRITVNKQTHRIKFENETEDSVDVVIEKKEHK